ncbi:flagellar hook-associated protein FlgK [Thiorhodococcus mannitoliphagus]|uniref:Flagellar hook-associated protein 1 n=1 Tax=Thiorhodococcus mannitoliphagus TaxID=329406 RepID=A0A6P1DZX6_9GAMM|nr:flagellar hook-associated protein FlgK [Thiorhodococcus mannitoliphagus]NEX21065.1 flagellar hook-associated protein FlgK [Thiorhodococcus mannitoliphagus]
MSILGTAVSGLLAYQRALATTSHNISNASTEGYSRQRVELEARNPQRLGGSYIGQGVDVSSVRRLQNDLVDAQLRSSLSNAAEGEVRAEFAERVDRLLADESTGLEPVLESFFNSTQDVASDPTSLPARTVMVNEAETLVERLHQINGLLDEQRTLINGNIETAVEEINQYSEGLANLNARIVSGFVGGATPNDLLDQRDVLLSKLSEKIEVNVNAQDDGSVNVFVGNGQSLVMGAVSNQLVADHLSGDPKNFDIGLKSKNNSGSAPIDVTRFMSGGELGALLETRTGMIDDAQNQLGLIGLNLAMQFNDQNGLGLDLNGEVGGDIFDIPPVELTANSTNSNNQLPGVTIEDVTKLTADDYRLKYSGTGFQLLRLPDNEVVDLDHDATTDPPNVYHADGLKFDTSSLLSPAAGDSWLIQPTRFAATKLEVAMTDPEGIAAAAAVYAEPSDLNTGDGTVLSVAAVDADTLDLGRVVLTYDGAAFTATAEDGSTSTVTPVYDSASDTTTVTHNGWEFKIQGSIAVDDEFVIDSNVGNQGDNRNMLLMANIQNERSVEGNSTIQGSYNSILAEVGTETRQAQIMRDSSATLLEDAQAQREAISGVNLDEEAADLIRYQQAYQAAAQVIAVSRTVFDTLINAVR